MAERGNALAVDMAADPCVGAQRIDRKANVAWSVVEILGGAEIAIVEGPVARMFDCSNDIAIIGEKLGDMELVKAVATGAV